MRGQCNRGSLPLAECSSSAVMKHLHPLVGPSNSQSGHTRKRIQTRLLPLKECCWQLALTCLFLLLGIDHCAVVIYVFCVVSMAGSVWFGQGVWSKPFRFRCSVHFSKLTLHWEWQMRQNERLRGKNRAREQRMKTRLAVRYTIHKPLVPPTVCS